MFEFQQNTLCVASSWLYETANLFSEGYYHKLVQRGKGWLLWLSKSLPELL